MIDSTPTDDPLERVLALPQAPGWYPGKVPDDDVTKMKQHLAATWLRLLSTRDAVNRWIARATAENIAPDDMVKLKELKVSIQLAVGLADDGLKALEKL